MQLLLHWHRWADRRVETVEFLDERRIRHHTSLDVTIPPWGIGESHSVILKDRIVLPIAYFRKGPLKNLDVYDEDGMALPVLRRSETQQIAHDVLLGLATGFVPGAPVSHELDGDLWRLIEDDPATAIALANGLPQDVAGNPGNRSPLGVLADDFASGFYLLVAIKAAPHDRRIIKYDYEEDYVPITTDEQNPFRRFGAWIVDQVEAFFTWLGWKSLAFVLPVPQAALASTYHLEISAPDELFIRSAELSVPTPRPSDKTAEECVDRAHLYVTRVPRGGGANAAILFGLEPQGLPSAALFTGFLTFAFLATGLFARFVLDAHPGPEAAAAIIVAVPGFFAAYLFRPGEHRLLRRVVRGVRLQTAGLAGVSFGAAGILAVNTPHGIRLAFWLVMTTLSGVGFLTSNVTYLIAMWFRHRQPG